MSPRRAGRPAGPHDDTLAKLLPAALRIFVAEGGAALTPTRLHRATGVARATIYRNWPEPDDLIEVMLQRATRLPRDSTPTDDLDDDLRRAMAGLLWRFDNRPVRAFFSACLDHGRRSSRVGTAAQAFVTGILEPFELALAAALERGDIDGEIDELVAEIAGPAVFRHVLLGESLTADDGQAMVERFLQRRR